MVKIKICGITDLADAVAAAEAGADFLGFNFYPPSPRFIDPVAAQAILKEIGPRVSATVGVFVNETLAKIAATVLTSGVDLVQLHGDEPPAFCDQIGRPVIKALRVGGRQDLEGMEKYKVWGILIDSRTPEFGGSGRRPDWALAAEAGRRCERLILAGGLTPENVGEAIRAARPWAVDAASGLESRPGHKDRVKIKQFIEAVKNVAG